MGQLKNNFRILLEKKYGVSGEARLPPQTKIAEDIGIKQPTVSLWLSGDVTRFDKKSIELICAFLNCDVGDLLYIADESTPEPA